MRHNGGTPFPGQTCSRCCIYRTEHQTHSSQYITDRIYDTRKLYQIYVKSVDPAWLSRPRHSRRGARLTWPPLCWADLEEDRPRMIINNSKKNNNKKWEWKHAVEHWYLVLFLQSPIWARWLKVQAAGKCSVPMLCHVGKLMAAWLILYFFSLFTMVHWDMPRLLSIIQPIHFNFPIPIMLCIL